MDKKVFKKRLAYCLATGLMFGSVAGVNINQVYASESVVASQVLTVSEAIAKAGGTDYVSGYIVGWGNGKYNLGVSKDAKNDAILIADSMISEANTSNVMAIKLKGDNQLKWGLGNNNDLLGRKITVYGLVEPYYKPGYGIQSLQSIEFAEDESTPTYKITANPESGIIPINERVKLASTTPAAITYTTSVDQTEKVYDENEGIVIDQDMTITAKFQDTSLSDKEFTFTYKAVELDNLTIADIRQSNLTNVAFKGKVTRVVDGGNYSSFYVQDDTAGMYVYEVKSGDKVAEGDEVIVSGTLVNYKGLLEIKGATVTKVAEGEKVAPKELTIAQYLANPNAYESQLICFKNVSLGDVNYNGNTTVNDGTGSISIHKIAQGVQEGYDLYDIVALGARYNDTYQLSVVNASDVIPTEGIEPVKEIIIKEGEALNLPQTLTVITNGVVTQEPIKWNEEDVAKVDNNTLGRYKVGYSVAGRNLEVGITVVSAQGVRISDIQGKSHVSPLKGTQVSGVQGVVTAIDKTFGFYMQDVNPDNDEATSDAIYVEAENHKLSVGTLVEVSGTVEEKIGFTDNQNTDNKVQLKNTQITATNLKTLMTGVALPEPVIIGKNGRMPKVKDIIDNDSFAVFDPEEDFIDFYESLEGMLVTIEDAQVVGPNKYKEIFVVPDRGEYSSNGLSSTGGVVISENTMHPEIISLAQGMYTKQPTVMVGDVFAGNVTGVLTYNDGNYKIAVSEELPEIEAHTYDADASTKLKETKDGLRIASFNVENLGGTAKQSKFDNIAKVLVEKLECPDIIGLQEVQDNDGSTNSDVVSASEVYGRIIEAVEKLNPAMKYDYVEIAPENNADGGAPGGNIRVGMLYRKDRVQLAPGTAGDATTAVEVVKNGDGSAGLSLNPGRIAPQSSAFNSTRKSLAAEFIFNGERVIVINNHLSSKLGDTPIFGNVQPATFGSEEKRIKQAEVVNDFVKQILAKDSDAKVVVLGDMNDYYFSDALKTLAGNELYNMHYALDEAERYTYSYQGKLQVLDNILVTKGLQKYTEIDILHMNSTRAKGVQLTDHDPVMIRMNMNQIPAGGSGSSSGSGSGNKNNTVVTKVETAKESLLNSGIKFEMKDNVIKAVTFKDVKNHWAQKDVEYLAARGIILGVGNEKFAPNAGIKAGDFKTLLSRIYEGEIVLGNLKEGKVLSRVEFATILKNTIGKNVKVDTTKLTAQFKDIKGLSNEEMEALAYVHELGILQGVTEDKLAPQTTLTRAQVATVMVRLLNAAN